MGHMRSAGALDRQRPHPLQALAVTSIDSISDQPRIGKKVLLAIPTPPVETGSNALSDPSSLGVAVPLMWSAIAGDVGVFTSFASIVATKTDFRFGLMTMEGGRRLSVVF